MRKNDEGWGAKLEVLKESIEHHIGEEEERCCVPSAAIMTRAELQRLGARMAAMEAKAPERPSPAPRRLDSVKCP